MNSVEAILEQDGRLIFHNHIRLPGPRRVLVTFLEPLPEPAATEAMVAETALLSEAALAEDWNRPEEDEAWAYLQTGR